MTEYRIKHLKPPQEGGRFYIGCDTHTLYLRTMSDHFIIVVGRGAFKGEEGVTLSRNRVMNGKGVVEVLTGTVLELTV